MTGAVDELRNMEPMLDDGHLASLAGNDALRFTEVFLMKAFDARLRVNRDALAGVTFDESSRFFDLLVSTSAVGRLMCPEGPEGFKGGLSAGKYSAITGASPATTTRDLADLVAMGAFLRDGERRHARYHLSVPLRPVKQVTLNDRGEIVES